MFPNKIPIPLYSLPTITNIEASNYNSQTTDWFFVPAKTSYHNRRKYLPSFLTITIAPSSTIPPTLSYLPNIHYSLLRLYFHLHLSLHPLPSLTKNTPPFNLALIQNDGLSRTMLPMGCVCPIFCVFWLHTFHSAKLFLTKIHAFISIVCLLLSFTHYYMTSLLIFLFVCSALWSLQPKERGGGCRRVGTYVRTILL